MTAVFPPIGSQKWGKGEGEGTRPNAFSPYSAKKEIASTSTDGLKSQISMVFRDHTISVAKKHATYYCLKLELFR